MGAPRKCDTETQARTVRMYRDYRSEHGDSKTAARTYVGALYDVNLGSIRNWLHHSDAGPLDALVSKYAKSLFCVSIECGRAETAPQDSVGQRILCV